MRVLHDPYFSIYVCKRIEQENFDLGEVLAYIEYTLLEKYLKDGSLFTCYDDSTDPKKLKDPFLFNSTHDTTVCNLLSRLSNNAQLSDFKSNEYYRELYSQASANEDNDVLDALSSIEDINNWISIRWQDDSPFSWGGVCDNSSERLINCSRKYLGESFSEKDKEGLFFHELEKRKTLESLDFADFRYQSRFLYENIKPYFRRLYAGGELFTESPLFALFNSSPEFVLKVETLLKKYEFIKSQNDKEIAKFLKFYMDSIFISQFFWFKSLSEENKITLLNRYCDDLNICISDTNLSVFGKRSFLYYLAYNEARKLYEERDYESSICIFSTIQKNTNDQYLNYLCASWIAEIYQETNEYSLSLRYYKKAYGISRFFTLHTRISSTLESLKKIHGSHRLGRFFKLNTKPHFVQYIELSNMAIMYCHLKDKHKANECFEKLNQELEGFSIPKKISILYDLALYFGDHQDLLKFKFLHILVELADIYEDSMVDAIEEDINEEIFPLFKLNEYWTREKCAREWITNIRSLALKHINEIEIDFTIFSDNSDKEWVDLVIVHEDNRFLQYKLSTKGNKIGIILEASGVRSKVFDTFSITSYTLEPKKSIIRLENTIKELKKIDRKENTKFEISGEVLKLHDVIQRLKLECSKCYYTLEDFKKAEVILIEVISDSTEEDILFRAHCLLGLVLIKVWDIRSGIRELEEALDLIRTEEALSDCCWDIFEVCKDELIYFNNNDLFYKVLHPIIDKINSKNKNKKEYWKNGYLIAVKQFNEFGLTVEAGHLIERGLSFEKNELVKVALLEEKAYLKYFGKDYAEAEDILKEIVRVSFKKQNDSLEYLLFCSSAQHKISVLYAGKREFKEAYKCMDCAINKLQMYNNSKGVQNSGCKLKRYEELKEIYDIFSRNVINLSKIKDKKIIDIFKTAEEVILDAVQRKKSVDFDFSLAFVEYGKGLETYLHDNFSVKLRKEVLGKHGSPVPDIYWWGDEAEDIERIPFELRNPLRKTDSRTINLGALEGLIENTFNVNIESINNPYVKDSYKFIRNFMPQEKWNIVSEACALVSKYRNGDAHYGKRPLKDIFRYRENIIGEINKVIGIVVGI